jgi:hypothetical protein
MTDALTCGNREQRKTNPDTNSNPAPRISQRIKAVFPSYFDNFRFSPDFITLRDAPFDLRPARQPKPTISLAAAFMAFV